MTPSEWLVLAAGIAGIAWVNWYFFLAGKSNTGEAASADEAREPA